MIRSFHYAAYTALAASSGRRASLEPWARYWYLWVSAAFLRSYLQTAEPAGFLPRTDDELRILLDLYLLEKAVYELGYEASHRPEWIHLPVKGILQLLGSPS